MAGTSAPAVLSAAQRQLVCQYLRGYLGSYYRVEAPLSLPTFGLRELRVPAESVPPPASLERISLSIETTGAKGLHSDPTLAAARTAIDGAPPRVLRVPEQMLVPHAHVRAAVETLPTHLRLSLVGAVIEGRGADAVAGGIGRGKSTVAEWVNVALGEVGRVLYGDEKWGSGPLEKVS